MNYKVMDNKLSLWIEDIEAGYIQFNKTQQGMEIVQTYVFPGFRQNRYAQNLVKYMVDNFDNEITKVSCSYYRIMSKDYKLSQI
ncbi:hypothetical protein RZE82_03490 [Mollicutes bacterium LVI A0039]|nr:hypothetical protein RZE82_03490 [Mollicutes bacterium LVI A0039]